MRRAEHPPAAEAPHPRHRPQAPWARPQSAWPLLRGPIELLTHLAFDLRTVGLTHVPRQGPCLVVANHTDHLDPIVLLVALLEERGRRTRFLALNELFDLPLTGWWLRRARAIPVARGRGAEPMIASARQALHAGELVVVYPEGRLPRQPGVRLPARRGVGALVRSLPASVPIVPVAHRGLEPLDARQPHPAVRVLERGPRHPVALAAGTPLRSSDFAGGDDGGAAAALLGLIRAQLEPLADRLVGRGSPS
jgi:1-acyl-sn-glycerol-3-phosphate acyltransferase